MLFFQPLNDMRENVCGITITTNHNNTNLKGEKKKTYTLAPRQLKTNWKGVLKSTTGEAQFSKYWRNQYNSGNRNSIVQNNLWWHLINQTSLFTSNTTEYRLPLVVLCAPFFFLLSLSIVPLCTCGVLLKMRWPGPFGSHVSSLVQFLFFIGTWPFLLKNL